MQNSVALPGREPQTADRKPDKILQELRTNMPQLPTFQICTSFEEAERAWRAIEQNGVLCHYQRIDWLRPWYQHIGRPSGQALKIVIGLRDDKPQFIWPFALSKRHGASQLSWIAAEHNNQNVGVWSHAAYQDMTREDALHLLHQIARQTGADTIALHNMPLEWAGRPFPLAFDCAQPSPSPIYAAELVRPFEDFLKATHSTNARRKLRQKHTALKKFGDLIVRPLSDVAEAQRALQSFLEQRAFRATETGVPSGFAGPEVKSWLHDLIVASTTQTRPLLRPYVLEIEGQIHATYLVGVTGSRIYAYSNSIAHTELMTHSPGIVLLADIIQDICDNAPEITELDIGIGYERYKTDWTKEVPLCDLTLGISVKGRLSAMVCGGMLRLKRAIKTNPHLWNAVRTLRRWRAKL